MNTAVQLALMLGPMAFYLYVIAVWQSGRQPRVVAGPLDFGLLLLGVSGLLVFGPIGWLMVSRAATFGTPSVWAWLVFVSSLGLLAVPWIPRSFRRLVIYNIEPEQLDQALRDALQTLPKAFERTLTGYEDRESHRGVRVEASVRFRTATLEAYGGEAETLIRQLARELRARLRGPVHRPSAIAWILLAICLALIMPVLGALLSRPQTRAALRALIERLHGG